jgi:hypothetical protein
MLSLVAVARIALPVKNAGKLIKIFVAKFIKEGRKKC